MTLPKFIITIGLPGSGKSTYLRKLADELVKQEKNLAYVGGDEIRMMIGMGSYWWKAAADRHVLSSVVTLSQNLAEHFDHVFVDDSLLSNTERRRTRLIELLLGYGTMQFVYLKTGPGTCTAQRRKVNKGLSTEYWERVIWELNAKMERPVEKFPEGVSVIFTEATDGRT